MVGSDTNSLSLSVSSTSSHTAEHRDLSDGGPHLTIRSSMSCSAGQKYFLITTCNDE
jgi:hypothetical protein